MKSLTCETGAETVRQLAADLQEPGMPEEVNTLGRTLESWREQISNWHRSWVANALTEAANKLMKRVKRTAFRFRNFANCRIRALLYAGSPTGPCWTPSLRPQTRRAANRSVSPDCWQAWSCPALPRISCPPRQR